MEHFFNPLKMIDFVVTNKYSKQEAPSQILFSLVVKYIIEDLHVT